MKNYGTNFEKKREKIMKVIFFLTTIFIQTVFCFSLISATPLLSLEEFANKKHKPYYDSHRLRKQSYSSLFWLILTGIASHQTKQDYPTLSVIFGIFALHNSIAMLQNFHESLYAAHEEDQIFDIIKCYITYHSK